MHKKTIAKYQRWGMIHIFDGSKEFDNRNTMLEYRFFKSSGYTHLLINFFSVKGNRKSFFLILEKAYALKLLNVSHMLMFVINPE